MNNLLLIDLIMFGGALLVFSQTFSIILYENKKRA